MSGADGLPDLRHLRPQIALGRLRDSRVGQWILDAQRPLGMKRRLHVDRFAGKENQQASDDRQLRYPQRE
jgi:hypothetical protein